MSKLEKTVLYLDPLQIERLREIKRLTGVPISASIRLAIDSHLTRKLAELQRQQEEHEGEE